MVSKTSPSANNPYASLLAQLTGEDTHRPKQKQVEQFWSKTEFESQVRPVFEERWALAGKSPKERTAFRAQVTRDVYRALPKSERDEWDVKCKEAHADEIKKWEGRFSGPPSTAPEDRQRYVANLLQMNA